MTFHFLSFIRYWNQRETSSLEWGKFSKARVERLRDEYPLSTLRGVRPLAPSSGCIETSLLLKEDTYALRSPRRRHKPDETPSVPGFD